MAWIELHQSVWTHKKTVMLAALVDIDEIYAAAHMTKLWTWALDNAPSGSLEGLPNKVIAFGAGWKGDADQFVDALVQAGWLDETEDGLVIHDWFDYAGRLIEKREANKERMRKARAKKKNERATNVQRTTDERAEHVQGLPNRTVPNHIDGLIDSAPAHEASETFEQAHKRVFGFDCNPMQGEQLQSYLGDGMHESVIVRAIERAAESGKAGYNFKFIRAIVENYFKNGALTLEQAIKLDEAHDKTRRRDPPGGKSRQSSQIDMLNQLAKEFEERDTG